MAVKAISEDRFIDRAIAALGRRAILDGFDFEAPDESLCEALRWDHKRGPRDYIVLANRKRILAVYRILYSKDDCFRLRWARRIPTDIKDYWRLSSVISAQKLTA